MNASWEALIPTQNISSSALLVHRLSYDLWYSDSKILPNRGTHLISVPQKAPIDEWIHKQYRTPRLVGHIGLSGCQHISSFLSLFLSCIRADRATNTYAYSVETKVSVTPPSAYTDVYNLFESVPRKTKIRQEQKQEEQYTLRYTAPNTCIHTYIHTLYIIYYSFFDGNLLLG
jgi:hypothetical protein